MAGKKAKSSKTAVKAAPRLRVYGAYRFNGQHPIIGDALKVIGDIKQVKGRGGPATGTLRTWQKKKNRAALSDTLDASLRTVGKKLGIVDA